MKNAKPRAMFLKKMKKEVLFMSKNLFNVESMNSFQSFV